MLPGLVLTRLYNITTHVTGPGKPPPPHSIPWKASCLLITIPAVSGQVILKKGPYLWEGSSRKKHKENN